MSKKTITTYYCDRCGKEISFGNIMPKLYYSITCSSLKLYYGEWRGHKTELCYDCGKELAKFLDGAKLAD